MNSERIDLLERGDSFAPATARVQWVGSTNVPANSDVMIPVTALYEVTGQVFEHVPSAQALRIKQAGVIGYTVNVVCNATGVGNINVLMRQASPLHEWPLVVQPYYLHAGFGFLIGGVRLVGIPAGGANYWVRVANTAGTGSFTLNIVDIFLVYLGRR
jgi:hypothetical protein